MRTEKLIFKLRASQSGKIMSGKIGLTETQEDRLKELKNRQDAYESSRKKANQLQELKKTLADLMIDKKQYNKNLKSRDISEEQYNDFIHLFESTDKKIKELTKELKGIAPLTERMSQEYSDLLRRKMNPILPQGAKTYLKRWLKEQLFGRQEEIRSKQIDKGNLTEEEGFTLMCVQLGLGMVYKNEEYKENDFFRGTCDLNLQDEVIDNKSSYSLFTFPMFEDNFENEDYYYQLQVYMDLYNKDKARLVYTLNDTPIEILRKELQWIYNEDEKQKAALNFVFTKDYFDKVKAELFPNAEPIDFIEVPARMRVKYFEIQKNPKVLQDMKQRVILCQKYIDELIAEYGI